MIYAQDIEPDDEDKFHTNTLYDEEGYEVIGWEYVLDEDGNKVPLEICICAAKNSSECACSCTSWYESSWSDCDEEGWYDEQMEWEEHREMSFGRHLDNF